MAKTLTTPIVVPEAVRRKAGLRAGEQVPKETSRADYPMETVMRIIQETKRRPLSPKEGKVLDAELMAYGSERAKEVGVKERDVTRIIHESRARRRTP